MKLPNPDRNAWKKYQALRSAQIGLQRFLRQMREHDQLSEPNEGLLENFEQRLQQIERLDDNALLLLTYNLIFVLEILERGNEEQFYKYADFLGEISELLYPEESTQ